MIRAKIKPKTCYFFFTTSGVVWCTYIEKKNCVWVLPIIPLHVANCYDYYLDLEFYSNALLCSTWNNLQEFYSSLNLAGICKIGLEKTPLNTWIVMKKIYFSRVFQRIIFAKRPFSLVSSFRVYVWVPKSSTDCLSLLCPAWLKSAGHIVFALSVCPSVRLSVRPCVRPTFCRHYSSETVRRSILIFIYVIPNILKLCTLVSVCPSVRLFGQNWRLNLGNFSLSYIVNWKCKYW